MKKIISRILIILIIFLLLFDFVFASQYKYVYAEGPGESFVSGVTSLASGIVAIVYTLLKALIVGATYGVQMIVTVTANAYGTNTDSTLIETVVDPITPIDIFFNKYKLTDINFFDFEGIEEESFIYLFRESIAQWYTIMKLIACAILLVILIYVGIRMAISTIADDKAKYKKMFADWIVSLLLIFILQYIIIFTIYCNDAIVKAIESAFVDNKMSSAVSESIVSIGLQGIINPGIISFASVLVYIFIVFQTIIFLLAYLKRMVKIGFLIMISPLITITYSIDKMGDGKAQALGNWLKEFIYTILIQPFHCIIYVALVQMAIDLLQGAKYIEESGFSVDLFKTLEYNQLAAGVLAIMCLKFVSDAEQIVKKIFGFKDDNSTGMAAGAAIGIAALANAQKIGGATRKSLNKFKANPYVKAIGKDFSNIKGRALNSKIVGKAKNAGSAVAKKASNAFSNTKVGSKAIKAAKGTATKAKAKKESYDKKREKKKKEKSDPNKEKSLIGKATSNIGKYMKNKASMSTALGVMAAAMKYSAGNSSAIEATTYGIGVQKGSQEFFSSSTGTMYRDIKNKRKDSEAYAHKKQIDQYTAKDKSGNAIDFTEKAKEAIKAHRLLERNSKEEELKKARESGNSSDEIKRLESELAMLGGPLDHKLTDEEIKTAQDTIAKYDPDNNLESFRDEDGNLHSHSENDFEGWKNDAEKRFKEGRKDRFISSTTGPSTRELDDTKNKIIAKLREIKKADKGNKKVGFDSELTVDEEANIESVAQTLIDNITVGVLRDKGFGQEAQKQLVASQLGLRDSGDNKLYEGINDLFNITDLCEEQARQKAIAADYAHVRSYDTTGKGVAQDSLLNRELKDYGESID